MQKTNIVILGHLDHGKSTLLGRLLYDSGSLPQEKIEEVKKTSEKLGKEMEFAFFIDSLEEEREDAMTIDIMHIPLKIKDRDYLLIDCPGHKELIKNMLSGASEANSAILIISAKQDEGIQEQTKRHLFLAKMLGIEQIFVVINKMDYAEYNEKRFNELKEELGKFLIKIRCDKEKMFFIPVSSKYGENISKRSEKIDWYEGDCLVDLISKNTSLTEEGSEKQFIGFVQDIYEIDTAHVIITRVQSGIINVNDEIIFNLGEERGKVKAIKVFGEDRTSACEGESIGLEVENVDYDSIKRGEVISKEKLNKTQQINAKIFVLSEFSIGEEEPIKIMCGTAERIGKIGEVIEKIDSSTAGSINENNKVIKHTEIAVVSLKLHEPIIMEKFSDIPCLGRFIIMKENRIVGAGIVV